MRCRSNKALAAIMAAAMLFSQSGTSLMARASEVSEEWTTEAQAAVELYEEGEAQEEYQEADSAEAPVTAEEPQAEEPQAETPQTESPQTEAPQTEAPQTEPPQTEPPQTEAPQTEPPQTEAPQTEAPQTEAPQTEAPQTEAPQTEAPQTEAPQTEAPQTEAPQTEAPQTEAPQTEAPQTEQPGTEPLLPADLIEIPEEETEETEELTEAMTDHFRSGGEGISIDVQLTGGEMLPESAWLEVTWLDASRQGAGYNVLLKQELEQGHRSIAGAEFFRIRIMDGEEELHPQNALHIVFRFDSPADLGVSAYLEGEAFAYQMEPWMAEAGRPGLEYDANGTGWLYGAEFEAPAGAVIAFAGVQNRSNTGEELTNKIVKEKLGKYLEHSILTNELEDTGRAAAAAGGLAAGNQAGEAVPEIPAGTDEGTQAEGAAQTQPETEVHTYAGEEELLSGTDENSAPDQEAIRVMLEDLSELSLKLADSRSSEDYEVVNLYADASGAISLTPAFPVMDETGTWLDVTDKRILVNVVAYTHDQELELPVFAVRDDDPERSAKLSDADAYARVLYNVTAWENGRFVPYTGKAVMKEATGGTWILPEGSLTVEKALLGAALADAVTLKEQAVFQAMPLRYSDEIPSEEVLPVPEILPNEIHEEEQEQQDAGSDLGAGEDYEKPLVIESKGGTWEYDGTAHSVREYKVTFGGEEVPATPVNNGFSYKLPGTEDTLTIIALEGATTSVTEVTEATGVENKIDYTLENEGNYKKLTVTPGALIVTPRPVTVKSIEDTTLVYNGDVQTVTRESTAEANLVEGLLEGHTHNLLSAVATGTDAGTYPAVYTYKEEAGALVISDADGKDVTKNYSVTLESGTLTINPKPVTVKGLEEAVRIYDGTEQTVTRESTAENNMVEGLVEGHTHNLVSASAVGTDIGTYTGKYNFKDGKEELIISDADGKDVTQNYSFTLQAGDLTISPRPVLFRGESAQYVYDGTEKVLSRITPEYEGDTTKTALLEGHVLNEKMVSYRVAGTNATSYTGAFTIKGTEQLILDSTGKDVTAIYALKENGASFVPGTLTITPVEHAAVTITVNSWYGTDKTNPFKGKAVYKLADSTGAVLKNASGAELEALTNETGVVSWSFDPAEYGVFTKTLGEAEPVQLQVLAEVPEGYYANRTAYPITVTRDTNGTVKVNRSPLFYYRDLLTDFTIMLSAEVKSSSSKNGYSYLAAEFTLKDESGIVITSSDGQPLTAAVTSDGATALVVDPKNYPQLAQALASGKEVTFTVEETTAPAGYYVNPVKKLILWQDKYGNVRVRRSTAAKAASGNVLNFRYIHKLLRTYFTVTAVDKDDEKTPLPGAAYVIRMADGTLVGITWLNSDEEVKRSRIAYTLGSSKNTLANLAVIDLRINPALETRLKEKGKATLTVSELTPPTKAADGKDATYKIYGSPDYKVTMTYDKSTGALAFDTKTVRMLNEKRSANETTNSDQIQVVKKQYEGANSIYIAGGAHYYMALFSDAKRKNRVSEVRSIRFVKGAVTEASTTFSGLEPGTYYVGETDQYGNLVGTEKKEKKATDPFYVEYDVDSVEVQGTTNRTLTVTASNHYFKLPDGAAYFVQVMVQKQLKDEKGADKASSGQFYFYLYSETGTYPLGTKEENGQIVRPEPYVISMNGASLGSRTISLAMPQETRTLRVREVDEDGVLLKNGDTYKITYSAENGAVTLSRAQTQPAVITITNQEIPEEEKEKAKTATLTLTKKVTYKGAPMRVNAAYYIGIFKSPEIKKENLLGTVSTSVRALALRNASDASTKPMTVRLDRIASHEVKLYFAETDREGNPVQSGTSTGYNISINGKEGNYAAVTLNAKNPKAEVVVTNDIISGGAQEKRLLNGSTGFAGDSGALAEAQQISNDTSAGVASRTGDDTPILPLVGALGGSAAVILLAILILRRRRK